MLQEVRPWQRILIVDDDIAVQATIRLLLERAGHSVVVAGDGRNGLAMFDAGDFDLLFLDIFMPGMDGLETMRLVHQQQPLTPDHRDLRPPDRFGSRRGPGLPDHGDQAWRCLQPAKAVQTGRPAGGGCGLS